MQTLTPVLHTEYRLRTGGKKLAGHRDLYCLSGSGQKYVSSHKHTFWHLDCCGDYPYDNEGSGTNGGVLFAADFYFSAVAVAQPVNHFPGRGLDVLS